MKYAKPTVILLESAVLAVQSVDKENGPNVDSARQTFTTSAYQADE
jgi:hypothetical protein